MTSLFNSILSTTGSLSLYSFLMSMSAALFLGFILAKVHMVRNEYNQGFIITLSLLPASVAVVIMMVNGNIGTGVAIAGAFGLVRFRSQPGTAREISSIFLAMAIGLATGMGYVAYATVFTLMISLFLLIYTQTSFGQFTHEPKEKIIKVTIPESLNYAKVFEDVFRQFTVSHQLIAIKTTNMGSMIRLTYDVTLKDPLLEINLINALRIRNANLEISSTQKKFNTPNL